MPSPGMTLIGPFSSLRYFLGVSFPDVTTYHPLNTLSVGAVQFQAEEYICTTVELRFVDTD